MFAAMCFSVLITTLFAFFICATYMLMIDWTVRSVSGPRVNRKQQLLTLGWINTMASFHSWKLDSLHWRTRRRSLWKLMMVNSTAPLWFSNFWGGIGVSSFAFISQSLWNQVPWAYGHFFIFHALFIAVSQNGLIIHLRLQLFWLQSN